MLKIIKSNIEARYASLQENSHHVSLIRLNQMQCDAIYLAQHQNVTQVTTTTENIFLSVFNGTGELQVTEGDESLNLQIVKGDIFLVPHNTSYTIFNTADECLMISAISIKE